MSEGRLLRKAQRIFDHYCGMCMVFYNVVTKRFFVIDFRYSYIKESDAEYFVRHDRDLIRII
jgi:hypothetical protein